jgi:glycosyltransferase involved in cell wall biosynthesis
MRNKLRIVQISPFYPPHLGGMENCAREISERLAKRGNDVEVYTSDLCCGGDKMPSSKNLKIHYLKSYEFAHTPIIPLLFFKLLILPKDFIVQLHIAQAFVPEIVWLVSKIKKTSYIVYVHTDLGPSGIMGFLLPLYKNIFLRRVLQDAKYIIVGTRDYVELIYKRYMIPKNRIIVIHWGTSLNAFKNKKIKSKKIKNILFVGRLSKGKNIQMLIQSFKEVLNRGYDLKLHIVGSGEEEENIISLINKNDLQDRVKLYGGLPWRDVSRIYSDFDLFVLPSREEAFGLVLLEAMASGLPIIASDIPGLRNVVKNNKTGILVKPSIENFTIAIEKMVNERDLREKLAKNGLKESEKYDWNLITEKFETVYRKMQNETN